MLAASIGALIAVASLLIAYLELHNQTSSQAASQAACVRRLKRFRASRA